MAVVAKFDVISVKKFTNPIITSSRIINGIVSNPLYNLSGYVYVTFDGRGTPSPKVESGVNRYITISAKPLVSNPSAIAIPPPNNNNIPQGYFFTASFQPKSDSFLFLLGSINKMIAEIIAIIVSSIDGII